MISLDDARIALLAACPVIEPVLLASAEAAGCVLAADVVASGNVPPFDNTSVDGYAIRTADLDGPEFEVLGTVPAGSVASAPVGPGQTWKVMTGAPLPPGADAVVMVENSSAEPGRPLGSAGDRVRLGAVAAGTGIRRAGSDVVTGDVVLAAGTVLRPAHLGVLGSVGARTVSAYRRLRVGVLVTGDELVTTDRALRAGEIYESNSAMLIALLRQANCDPVDLGVASDDLDDLQARLTAAQGAVDAIVTSGGVSMGDADPVKAVLGRMGRLNWLQVAIRPAKPFAYGVLDGPVLLLGLPGNPVSSLVSFELLARPALRQMMGHPAPLPVLVPAIADAALTRPHGDGRTAYLRVASSFGPDGRLHVRPVTGQDSHQLSASAGADALAVVADGDTPTVGSEVLVQMLA